MDKRIIAQSTKWSAITELLSKIMTPLVNIVLARLLTPDVFGVIATLTMVITFAEIFTDAGFQKYLIQHEFSDGQELERATTVAFWTNLGFSLAVWLLIVLFRDYIAAFAGSEGYGLEIAVLSAQIPLVAVSSIQTALMRRNFNFKELLPLRVLVSLVPLVVTIPIAYVTRNCWALIVGSIAKEIVNAILLTIKSSWKPRVFYNLKILKSMLGVSLLLMLDALIIWLTSYMDTLLVGRQLDSYQFGLYKTGATTVSPYISLIYTMLAPVLFAGLSRLQNNRNERDKLFLDYQRVASFVVVLIGIAVLQYRDLVTKILLGEQWMAIAPLVGYIGFTHTLCVLVPQFNSDFFRAAGKPQVAFAVQGCYLLVIIIALTTAVRTSFDALIIAKGFVGLAYIVFSSLAMWFVFKITPCRVLRNLAPALCSAVAFFLAGTAMNILLPDGLVFQFVGAAISCVVYAGTLLMIPVSRDEILKNGVAQRFFVGKGHKSKVPRDR